jgi:hypothetical protein
MSLDSVGRVIVGSGHFTPQTAAVAMAATGVAVVANNFDRVNNVIVGGGHFLDFTFSGLFGFFQRCQISFVRTVADTVMNIPPVRAFLLRNPFIPPIDAVERRATLALTEGRSRDVAGPAPRISRDVSVAESVLPTTCKGFSAASSRSVVGLERANFVFKTHGRVLGIFENNDSAWEAYRDTWRERNAEHLSTQTTEALLTAGYAAAGDYGNAMDHAVSFLSDLTQENWEHMKDDAKAISDYITDAWVRANKE